MPGPVGFRGGSDTISSIQGGAESHLGAGEVRPFSPGYDPSVDPGAGLWVDPNAAADPANQSPFGLDDACVDDLANPDLQAPGETGLIDNWLTSQGTGSGITLPITQSNVTGLVATIADLQAQIDALGVIGYIDGGSAFSIPPSGGAGAIDGGSA